MAKILQVRTLVPLAKASYASKPGALTAKRSGVLNGYRNFAEKKGIEWRADAETLRARGDEVWEKERAKMRRLGPSGMPEYYRVCYEGPIHSYDRGNGEWMAAFDAPSAYLLVHLHHFPAVSPQAAFDALHEELDLLALKHLAPAGSTRPVRCVDVGCGAGTSTFSTVLSLEKNGNTGKVTGVDLSDYFITVAEHIKEQRAGERNGKIELEFLHGDGLNLKAAGFGDGEVDLLVVSEVTHEMPKVVSEALFKEAARALAPGGILGYMDLNPVQILKENAVGNLVDRIAASNEPYFAEYLELECAEAMREAGLEVLEETWPHHAKYPTCESCSLRFIIARKPAKLSLESWTGKWEVESREDWTPYLGFLGVPEAVQEAATKAPDFHEYVVSETSFFMDHRIPGQNMHLRFTGFIDDEFSKSPYPVPTAVLFDKDSDQKPKEYQWKHKWIQFPTCFETTIPDFAGKGKTVTLRRELVSMESVKFTVHVLEPETGGKIVGPCNTYFRRTSFEPPSNVVHELRERFNTGVSRSIEWRQEKIDAASNLVLENIDALSAAQAADHVTPSNMFGAAMMLKGAQPFYKYGLKKWAEPETLEETLPEMMRTEESGQNGEWKKVPEPKGVGLVIAPWNAPTLLCVLPMMGMLAAGNLVVLKPAEAAPATSRLIARLVAKYFPDRSVVVEEGGKEVVGALVDAPPDHIIFTGGGEIAKIISARAARHLTPCSLELGGKNPCYIDASSKEKLSLYAQEIIGTKHYFGGQFCQSMDYCLVHEKVYDEFLALLEAEIVALGAGRQCQMINAGHAGRLWSLLKGQEAKARPALPKAEEQAAADKDTVPLSLVVEPDVSSAIMAVEIFGPLMAVFKVTGADEAVEFVNKRPKPLVAYCYSEDEAVWEKLKDTTSSGNLAVNCGPQRMQSNFNAGFGGVGDSGYGHSIWGRAAFDDYSHHKTVFFGKGFGGSVWGANKPVKGKGKGK